LAPLMELVLVPVMALLMELGLVHEWGLWLLEPCLALRLVPVMEQG